LALFTSGKLVLVGWRWANSHLKLDGKKLENAALFSSLTAEGQKCTKTEMDSVTLKEYQISYLCSVYKNKSLSQFYFSNKM